MFTLNGYEIIEEFWHSFYMSLYRGIRKVDGKRVLIKVLKEAHADFFNIARWKYDYEVAQSLPCPGILKPYELRYAGSSPALVLEDFGGQPLCTSMELLKSDTERFLDVAMDIVRILKTIHRYGMHKNINPQNIFIHPHTNEVKITDFGLTSLVREDNQPTGNCNLPYDTLAYISPEQTGRLNRAIDCRSDLYSLGIMFYEILTGRLPFACGDPGELVHCHIACTPLPPREYNANIPLKISQIVMKLLAKAPEERYQSAFGLEADFNICREQWRSSRQIQDFVSGQQDGFCMNLKLQQHKSSHQDDIFTTLREFSVLDWMALLKASRYFSQEESWGQFMYKWLHTVIEIAGAQRGMLVLKKGDKLFVEAEVSDNIQEILQAMPLELSQNLSQCIVAYAARTGENIILANASEEGAFTKDPYVVKQRPRSVLSLPLFKHSTLLAILYLENNLISDAFSPERLDILKMLSLQGCIFLENIRLSEELEKRNK
jgi:serine/threonine protein kinase